MPVTYIGSNLVSSAEEAIERTRRSLRDDPVFGKIAGRPVIVEARLVVECVAILPSGEDLERRRWEVYWTYRGMADPRPWKHPEPARQRRQASELPGNRNQPAANGSRTRSQRAPARR
jgi:hypothetical protein